jgi:hypothetical protein
MFAYHTHSVNIGVVAANVFGFTPIRPVAASCENTVTFPGFPAAPWLQHTSHLRDGSNAI